LLWVVIVIGFVVPIVTIIKYNPNKAWLTLNGIFWFYYWLLLIN
jgi:hypothetical protein